jgi:hypothetical protein
MIELIFIIILVVGFLGMTVVLWRKAPALSRLPEPADTLSSVLFSKIKEKTMNFPGVKDFSYELYLQKILSKISVFTLKTDSKTSNWLEKLRQKNNEKNHSPNDDYWEELKKAKNGK